MGRSPNIDTSRPLAGANSSRMRAKPLMTADTAVTPTLKLLAKAGSAGETIPMPTAMMNAPITRTQISRGSLRELSEFPTAFSESTELLNTPPVRETPGSRSDPRARAAGCAAVHRELLLGCCSLGRTPGASHQFVSPASIRRHLVDGLEPAGVGERFHRAALFAVRGDQQCSSRVELVRGFPDQFPADAAAAPPRAHQHLFYQAHAVFDESLREAGDAVGGGVVQHEEDAAGAVAAVADVAQQSLLGFGGEFRVVGDQLGDLGEVPVFGGPGPAAGASPGAVHQGDLFFDGHPAGVVGDAVDLADRGR